MLAGTLSPFLVERGFSTVEIGDVLLFGATPGMVIGALVGGRLSDRAGARKIVAWGSIVLAVSVFTVAGLPSAAPGAELVTVLLVFYLAVGAFTASSYALFMRLTTPAVAATQFTAFMAMTNLCEFWSVHTAGEWIAARGFSSAFAFYAAVSLLALPLLLWMRPRKV